MKYNFFIFLFILNSCGKDFLDRKNPTNLTTDTFYKTEKDANEAILAVYSVLQGPRFYGYSYYAIMEMASDDVTTKLASHPIDDFKWLPNDLYSPINDLWALYYEGIFRANMVIENVPNVAMDEVKKKQILAEAYFLRGVFFWHLAITFGKGPILLNVMKSHKDLYPISSERLEIFKQSESDLIKAKMDLPASWDDANLGRATTYSAQAFLGKTYLYHACYAKDVSLFSKSATELRAIVNSGRYKLLKTFNEVFSLSNENNSESLFEIQYAERGPLFSGSYSDGGNAGEGTQRDLRFGIQIGAGQQGFSELIATEDWSLNLELGDPRIRASLRFLWDTIDGFGVENKQKLSLEYNPYMAKLVRQAPNETHQIGQYYHVKKGVHAYTGLAGITQSPANWPMIRYSDVLLMLAEAINESEGATNEAVGYLNQVRKRAKEMSGLSYAISNRVIESSRVYKETISGENLLNPFPYTAINGVNDNLDFSISSKENLRAALVMERRAELAFEYHRFPDMQRWEAFEPNHPGAASNVFTSKNNLEDVKNYDKNSHSRLPIPEYQIQLSKGTLTQNPGY